LVPLQMERSLLKLQFHGCYPWKMREFLTVKWLEKYHSILTLACGIILYVIAGAYQVGSFKTEVESMKVSIQTLDTRIGRVEDALMKERK
jgi:hypothetical protein